MKKDSESVQLSPRQQFLYEAMEYAAEKFGPFDLTTGADGIHYAPSNKNPFKNEGLVCKNCVFFEGGGGCELVSELVEPEAVCKFWIIPQNLLSKSLGKEVTMSEEIEKVNDVTQAEAMQTETPLVGEDKSFTDPTAAADADMDDDAFGYAQSDNDEDDKPSSPWAGFFSPVR